MMYKTYSDSYLKTMTKESIIRQLRCAEHNMYSAEKTLEQQIENTKDWVPVRHGRWIEEKMIPGHYYELVRCSECGRGFGAAIAKNDYKFCPNCGARMDLPLEKTSDNGGE